MENQKALEKIDEALNKQHELLAEAQEHRRIVGASLHSYAITTLKNLKEQIENE